MDAFDLTDFGPLAASVVIVFLFLQYLRVQKAANIEAEKARLDTLSKIGDACHQHSEDREERMITVLDRTNNMLDRSVESHGKVLQALEQLDHNVRTSPGFIDKLQSVLLRLDKRLDEEDRSRGQTHTGRS